MSDEALKRQIELCNSSINTENFTPAVDALLNMLPAEMRSEIENVDGVYKESQLYVPRFINNVVITMEFVTIKTLDHDALYSVILDRIKKS
jgi:hypothetical protein